MSKQVFYDPQRKRWKRLRRIFDVLALLGALVGVIFIVGLVRMKPMQGLDLRSATKRYRALSNPPAPELKSREKLNRSRISLHHTGQPCPFAHPNRWYDGR